MTLQDVEVSRLFPCSATGTALGLARHAINQPIMAVCDQNQDLASRALDTASKVDEDAMRRRAQGSDGPNVKQIEEHDISAK